MNNIDQKQVTKVQKFVALLEQIKGTIPIKKFMRLMADSPFYYSQKLSQPDTYIDKRFIDGLKTNILDITKHFFNERKPKRNLYNKIDEIFDTFQKQIYDWLDEDQLNQNVRDSIWTDIDDYDMFYKIAYKDDPNFLTKLNRFVHGITVSGIKDYVYDAIIHELNSRKAFYVNEIKGWINSTYERLTLENVESSFGEEVKTLKELKTYNSVGREFGINSSLIDEINSSVKDKFIWAEGNLITSRDGLGLHHGQMQQNYIKKRRGGPIDTNVRYIGNSRTPEDMSIDYTEEEANIPMAFGSYYFNGEVCIIEGRYLIHRGDKNYNRLIDQLKKRFKRVFDLTIENKSIKQEAKLAQKL